MPARFYVNNTKGLCVNVQMSKTKGMLSCIGVNIGVNIGVKLLSKFIYFVSALRV